MVCGVCGADWPPGAVFCLACGTSVAQVEPTSRQEIAPPDGVADHAGEAPSPGCAQCGATNPRGAQRCLTCFAPMEDEPASRPFSVSLLFPWGARSLCEGDRLLVGRAHESELAGELRPFADVSRRHAELHVTNGALLVRDLDSMNGTFRNDTRLSPETDVMVAPGDSVRFGDLVVGVQVPKP